MSQSPFDQFNTQSTQQHSIDDKYNQVADDSEAQEQREQLLSIIKQLQHEKSSLQSRVNQLRQEFLNIVSRLDALSQQLPEETHLNYSHQTQLKLQESNRKIQQFRDKFWLLYSDASGLIHRLELTSPENIQHTQPTVTPPAQNRQPEEIQKTAQPTHRQLQLDEFKAIISEVVQSQQLNLHKEFKDQKEERSRFQSQIENKLSTLETELKYLKNYLGTNQDNLPQSHIEPSEKSIDDGYQVIQTNDIQPQPVPSNQSTYVPQLNWVSIYNHNPDSFSEQVTEVSETEESINQRRSGVNQPVVIEKIRRGKGTYWVLTGNNLGERENYLVPKGGLKINEFNFKTVQSLFECNGDTSGTSSKFILVKPAIVFPIDNEKWQLAALGVLQFESNG